MSKRHDDALFIGAGACNPSGIANAIFEACREARAEPGHTGTAQLCADPAIRLMVHQLAHLCKVFELDDLVAYSKVVQACNAERV
jgi:hypothetical protein